MQALIKKQNKFKALRIHVQDEPTSELFKIEEEGNSPFIVQNTIQNNKHNLANKLCQRCFLKQDKIECQTCKLLLCKQCDSFLHAKGKFVVHQRKLIFLLQSQQNDNKMNIRIREIKQDEPIKNIQQRLTTLNITQKWDKIINEVSTNFEKIANQLIEKKQQLIIRLQKRKAQQLKNYVDGLHQMRTLSLGTRKSSVSDEGSNMKKSHISDKPQSNQTRLKQPQCDHLDQAGKCLGNIQLQQTQFQQLKSLIEKIDIKNIINKTICNQQSQQKKKMRTSLLNITSNGSSNSSFNLGFRSPKSGKQKFNQTIFLQQMKNIKEKLNQEEFESNKNDFETGKILQKVKSQKFLGKSKNISLILKQKDKKVKKLGIMI